MAKKIFWEIIRLLLAAMAYSIKEAHNGVASLVGQKKIK